MTVTALIAEDEPLLRAELRALLGNVWPELQVVAEAEDGTQALEAFAAHLPQVVFLDVRMPGASGLDVARAIAGRAHVVFVTAHDEFAIDAFENEAADYIVKPVREPRLRATVSRLRRRLESAPAPVEALLARLAQAVGPGKETLRWITASQGKQTRLILVQDIVYFQSDNKYTRVVCADGESLIRKPIRELLAELDPAVFRQVHRSTIVNVGHVKTLLRDEAGRGHLHLKSRDEVLAVSDAFLPLFRQM